MTASAATLLIGIDCATKPEKVGLALGNYTGEQTVLRDAKSCDRKTKVVDQVCEWMSQGRRVLLAMDAPLGWPDALGRTLLRHFAGEPIHCEAGALFHRATDEHVRRMYRKTPLEVGADRIARTAHAALAVLDGVRSNSGHDIPLAWEPGFTSASAAIEVYPAASAAAEGWDVAGYRDAAKGRTIRAKMVDLLAARLTVECGREHMLASPDALDAAICVWAGAQFLKGQCVPPTDDVPVKREGWIWVAMPTPDRKSAHRDVTPSQPNHTTQAAAKRESGWK